MDTPVDATTGMSSHPFLSDYSNCLICKEQRTLGLQHGTIPGNMSVRLDSQQLPVFIEWTIILDMICLFCAID